MRLMRKLDLTSVWMEFASMIGLLTAMGTACGASSQGGQAMSYVVDSIPAGYHMYAYDDCGVAGHQPHVDMADCYFFTFSTADTDADLQSRSAVFSYKEIRINYDNLDSKLSYLLAMTYASDQVYKRVQSLEANGIELHGPIALPNGKAIRRIVKVPASAIKDGELALKIKIHGEVNATVSTIELWASAPPPGPSLQINSISATPDGLAGKVMDLKYDGLGGGAIRLERANDQKTLATAVTQPDGAFSFPKSCFGNLTPEEDLEIVVNFEGKEVRRRVSAADVLFEPVRYRPIPARVMGLKKNVVSLDGSWRIDPKPGKNSRDLPLDSMGWGDFHVPGQWAQQGYEIPRDKTAALAREFTIPAEWTSYRIFLRFDAIHGGTHYWLNGKPLGYSENLYTPVEWEITDAAKAGQVNRLDLEMVVDTASERLSCSSSYAGYTLGGIDRSVKLYALPRLHIANMRLNAGLDEDYKDGELQIELGLDNPNTAAEKGLAVAVRLYDAGGKEIIHTNPSVALDAPKPGLNNAIIESHVPNPLKWNAEQPNLYKLILELRRNGKSIERIERSIGFRRVEIRNRQLYVNGVRVKLAGVCHHEIDPLTGRADTMCHAEQDVKFFKNANLNHVRTSHYPPTQEFLDAADRYGLYVESEAPLCWVAPAGDLTDLKEVLTSTSAMIDYNHTHPSVIMWSIANESHWSDIFDYSNKLCKLLDPTRPTTINHAFSNEDKVTCDIINRHYQPMPYDDVLKDDPRPFLHGECFFLVYHERTDVAIDPGLRELWIHGSADPSSEWGKNCAGNYGVGLIGGIYPGAWSHIYASKRVIGSEIWSGVDDIAFMPDGRIVSSENGNAYWGLIDGWRRPKPELWYTKMIFSPVWFPVRQLSYKPGQSLVRVPVENRYSFTDLSACKFTWELNGEKGEIAAKAASGSKGEIEVPVPQGTPEGSVIILHVIKDNSEIVNAAIRLGKPKQAELPKPRAGAPEWSDDGKTITVQGKGFSFVLDRAKGDFDALNPGHKSPIMSLPALHITRHDFGDLDRNKPPYAVFPDAKTRVVDGVTVTEKAKGLEITVKDNYDHFAGSVSWLIDRDGVGEISYDYTYTGDDLDTREIGLMARLQPDYDEIKWKRWSEWGVFPQDCISRTVGSAKAHRGKKWPAQAPNVKPLWPWSQDETKLGTADFRSIKFNIYQASLVKPGGSGVRVNANADVHFRACLGQGGVEAYMLRQCPLAAVKLKSGERIAGRFVVELLHR